MADLLVLGPGRLGIRIAQKWQSEYPSSNIYLKFKSENPERSKEMEEKGFKVLSEGSDIKVNKVVFCAPPHGNPDYPADVEQGFSFLKSKGILVFTSSGSVYKENNGGEINEGNSLQNH
ncbi:uncharacterized protein LOC111702851 [Eurytemora carolleeae]|uniref:uncharacterized protein LOC111702851 n=1 Tax=Eurytemora carolleeae TaxID=1294199 RepID=UPI000C79140C|nr:uncharacterized protein LOC111702851 [Eurytemora carolleeae]|eukprot:XP_023330400.1 uncharacterized protein LOC111702851 [Eurytemora affinis]